MTEPGRRTLRQWLGIYLRGMVMGVAELVPGVSGGTIAFVTGIYDELVNSLAGLRPSRLVELRAGLVQGTARLWTEFNLTFLLVLGLGMVSSVILLAQVLSFALTAYRPVVWGFFLGIIALSVWLLGRNLPRGVLARRLPLGLLCGLVVILVDPFAGSQALPVFFFAGAIAVSAWLLPAVSGSFVLLTLGLYDAVIKALATPDLLLLAVFLAGCATGLMLFSRALSLALQRWREGLLAGLTGFMIGASLQLWPWQVAGDLVLPGTYAMSTGEPALLVATLFSLSAGGVVIWLLSRFDA